MLFLTLTAGLALFYLFWGRCCSLSVTLISIHMTDYGRDGYVANVPILDVVVELIRNSNPSLFSNFTHFALRYGHTILNTSMGYSENQSPEPCDATVANFSDFFWQFYYKHSDLFRISSDQMTILTSAGCNEMTMELANSIGEPSVPLLLSTPSLRLMDNKRFPTVLNVFGMPDENFVISLVIMAKVYSWKTITVVCDAERSFQNKMCDQFQRNLNDQKSAVQAEKLDLRSNVWDVPVFDKILDKVSSNRVSLVLLGPPMLRIFMIAAYKRNMTNGEFVYITIGIQSYLRDNFFWKANDQHDENALLAFQSLLIIMDSTPDRTKFVDFSNRLDEEYAEKYNWSVDSTNRDNGKPTFLLEFLLIFADTFSLVWTRLGTLTAASFVQLCLNRTYNLLTRKLYINPLGKLIVPVPVKRLSPSSLLFEVVMLIDVPTERVANESNFTWFEYGSLPADFACGFREGCLFDRRPDLLIIIPVLIASIFAVLVTVTILLRGIVLRKQFEHLFVDCDAITFPAASPNPVSYGSDKKEPLHGLVVQLNEKRISAKRIAFTTSRSVLLRNNKFCKLALLMIHTSHNYLATFYGFTLDKADCYILYETSERGTLKSMLNYDNIFQDMELRLFFVDNLIQGLLFIHRTQLLFHGQLSSSVCLLSSRYSLRIAQAGFLRLSSIVAADGRQKPISIDPVSVKKWQKQDIMELGQILIEMFASGLQKIEDGAAKITFNLNVPVVLQNLIYACISRSSDSMSTKSLQLVSKRIRRRNREGIVQLLLSRLEEHAEKLEESIYQRTLALHEETHKVDNLLRMMLPEPIIKLLRNLETVAAELFSSATVMFSDIPAFLSLVKQCTPLEVVSFLDNIHSRFDETVGTFDAYKVETINDSYVIVSGVPTLNGETHASTLCALALRLLIDAKSSGMSSTKNFAASVRIGINSGPVAAGVVGTRMPRYCLFGDTMNTASRMESCGEADKVHVSHSTKQLAKIHGHSDLKFQTRGLISIKGKGMMETYWLLS